MHLFGNVLFTNLVKIYVPLIYLTFLDDFTSFPYIVRNLLFGMPIQTSMSCMHEKGQIV